jgi:hypothetical protein
MVCFVGNYTAPLLPPFRARVEVLLGQRLHSGNRNVTDLAGAALNYTDLSL